MSLQSLTLKCISMVLSLKISLQLMGNVGLYSMDKEVRKAHFKIIQTESFAGHLRVG